MATREVHSGAEWCAQLGGFEEKVSLKGPFQEGARISGFQNQNALLLS